MRLFLIDGLVVCYVDVFPAYITGAGAGQNGSGVCKFRGIGQVNGYQNQEAASVCVVRTVYFVCGYFVSVYGWDVGVVIRFSLSRICREGADSVEVAFGYAGALAGSAEGEGFLLSGAGFVRIVNGDFMVGTQRFDAADCQIFRIFLFCRESRINGVVGFIFYGNDEVLPKIKFFQILKAFQKGCLLKTVLSIQDLDALLFSVRRTVLFFCLFSGYLVQVAAIVFDAVGLVYSGCLYVGLAKGCFIGCGLRCCLFLLRFRNCGQTGSIIGGIFSCGVA